jgi:hypothetical protein
MAPSGHPPPETARPLSGVKQTFPDELLTVVIVSYFSRVRDLPRRCKNKESSAYLNGDGGRPHLLSWAVATSGPPARAEKPK